MESVYIVTEYIEAGESMGAQVDELTQVTPHDAVDGEVVCEGCPRVIHAFDLIIWSAIDESAQSSCASHAACVDYTSSRIHLITLDKERAKSLAGTINEEVFK